MNVFVLMRSDIWGVDNYPEHVFLNFPSLPELEEVALKFIHFYKEEFIATEKSLQDGYEKGDYYCQVSSGNYFLYLYELPAS